MKLDVRHTLPCSAERFWQMYWSDSFDEMSRRGSTFTATVVDERTEGAVTVTRVRFEPERTLPRPVASVVGSTKLIYDQENRYDPARGTIDFRLIPTFLPDKLSATGTMRATDTPGGCALTITGDIQVRVRFIGGQVEKAVVQEVAASYDRMAATAREWLQAHGSAVS